MTNTEYITHFSLWALAKSPLIIGCDVRSLDASTFAILSNKEVIAINQDALGAQGHLIASANAGTIELWAGPLASGAKAALVLNLGDTAQNYTINFSDIGAPECNDPRDLWAHQDLGETHTQLPVTVESHGVKLILLTPCQKQQKKTQEQRPPRINGVEVAPVDAPKPHHKRHNRVALE